MLPQRIMLCPSDNPNFSAILASMEDALRSLGVAVIRLNIPRTPTGAYNFSSGELKKISFFQPDYIFFIGLTGIIKDATMQAEEHLFEKTGIPYVQFFFDFPMNFPLYGALAHRYLKHVFTFDREYIPLFHHFGFDDVSFLPHAFLYGDQVPAVQPHSEQLPLSFVGSISDNASIRQHYQQLNPVLQEIADRLVNEKIKRSTVNIFSLDVVRSLGNEIPFFDFFWYIDSRYGNYQRRTYISELAQLQPTVIYGNDAWECMRGTPQLDIRSTVDLTELPSIFQASRINLNFSAAQLVTAVNQRVIDCYGCGGFLLSDYREDLDRLFEDCPVKIPSFVTTEEMLEKCSYYLQNPQERRELTNIIQQYVLQHHTWKNRMQEVLSILSA